MLFRTRVWLLPISAATVFLVGTAISYAIGERAYGVLQHIQESDDPYREHVARIDGDIEKFRLLLEAVAGENDASGLKHVEPLLQDVRKTLDEIKHLDGKAEAASQMATNFEAYQSAAMVATKAMLGTGDPAGNPAELVARMQATRKALDGIMQLRKTQARQDLVNGEQAVFRDLRSNLMINVFTGGLVLLVLGLASKLVVKSVWSDLGDEPAFLRARVQRVAEGDLVVDGLHKGDADEQSLNAAVRAMAHRLCSTIDQIRATTEIISTASKEMAQGNLDLSQRTEQAASSLQRTTSSVEMLTAAVHQSTEAARQAQSMVAATSDAAERGGAVVSQVVENMEGIYNASKKISDITGVIDSIAFQTNILALNAAVEAARAGEQGRGFAVVASEVRNLAKRSADAAHEIKTLINASAEQVGSGTQLVREAGEAMSMIVSGVQRVTDVIEDISASAAQQSVSIDQVNQTVVDLDRMTQQNASLVQQSTAAAEHLKSQATDLERAVAAFRTQ